MSIKTTSILYSSVLSRSSKVCCGTFWFLKRALMMETLSLEKVSTVDFKSYICLWSTLLTYIMLLIWHQCCLIYIRCRLGLDYRQQSDPSRIFMSIYIWLYSQKHARQVFAWVRHIPNPGLAGDSNQNFRAEIRKYLGVKWIATGPNGLVPLAKQVSRSFKVRDVVHVSLLLVLRLDDDFDGDMNDIVWSCFIHSNLTSITGYFEQTTPRNLPYDFKHHVQIKWRKEQSKFSREINRL